MTDYQFYRNNKNSANLLQDDDRPKCVFFAEGETEALFLEKWLLHLGKNPSDIAVICFKGQSNLSAVFKLIASNENFQYVKNLGFFLDAEQNGVKKTLSAIEGVIRRENLLNGNEHISSGHQQLSKIDNLAIYISPDNSGTGFIEDTVLKEVQASNLSTTISSLESSASKVLGRNISSKSLVTAYITLHVPGLCGTQRGFETDTLHVMHHVYDDIRSTFIMII